MAVRIQSCNATGSYLCEHSGFGSGRWELVAGSECEAARGQLAQGLGLGIGTRLVVVDEAAGLRAPDPDPESVGSLAIGFFGVDQA